MKNILITGGAGFIGSNFVKFMLHNNPSYKLIVYDKLTYAGNLGNLKDVMDKIEFVYGDICDLKLVVKTLKKYEIDAVVNFAAETHVDNSIKNPFVFTQTNVIGTHILLEAVRKIWGEGSSNKFIHISTDEVYGALADDGYFTEKSMINPSSPYSSSKASSDLLVLSYFKTYKMNVSVTNCSNNYGPFQHKEKLIPHMIECALKDKKLPVYGNGLNIRDWLYVEDHCEAINLVLHKGKAGERYNIGGNCEKRNIDIVKIILKELKKDDSLIQYVKDRKGHDYRYAIDSIKIQKELGWEPKTNFEEGIKKTIKWYVEHRTENDSINMIGKYVKKIIKLSGTQIDIKY